MTKGRSDFVFYNTRGNPLEYHNVNRSVWHPLLERAGLERRRAYQTRHTAATLWLASGENPEWIAKQMGHDEYQQKGCLRYTVITCLILYGLMLVHW
ncbi:tyrosine-type recombinase/integrase [Cardiobacteriaceae bacterium TAE3-ERU3]|nr:tyrosine-type recombinase/integrase [Cardiobacteriaceae bacterium TAE3-ERU3]